MIGIKHELKILLARGDIMTKLAIGKKTSKLFNDSIRIPLLENVNNVMLKSKRFPYWQPSRCWGYEVSLKKVETLGGAGWANWNEDFAETSRWKYLSLWKGSDDEAAMLLYPINPPKKFHLYAYHIRKSGRIMKHRIITR